MNIMVCPEIPGVSCLLEPRTSIYRSNGFTDVQETPANLSLNVQFSFLSFSCRSELKDVLSSFHQKEANSGRSSRRLENLASGF